MTTVIKSSTKSNQQLHTHSDGIVLPDGTFALYHRCPEPEEPTPNYESWGRNLGYGKHWDQPIEKLLLVEPLSIYQLFCIGELHRHPHLARAQRIASELISAFDAKPLEHEWCGGKVGGSYGCQKPPQHATLNIKGKKLVFWCEDCLPQAEGMIPIGSFFELMNHLVSEPGFDDTALRSLMRQYREAKGLSGRLTERKVLDFYGLAE